MFKADNTEFDGFCPFIAEMEFWQRFLPFGLVQSKPFRDFSFKEEGPATPVSDMARSR